jgi:hypothetical protein
VRSRGLAAGGAATRAATTPRARKCVSERSAGFRRPVAFRPRRQDAGATGRQNGGDPRQLTLIHYTV